MKATLHPHLSRSPRKGVIATARGLSTAMVLILALGVCGTAAAQHTFTIKGFQVTGDNPLPDGETTRILAPFLRADASLETLQRATAALEDALRDQGFSLYRVALPPQELGDTIALQVLHFSVNEVGVVGAKHYGEDNIRRSLPELQPGQSPNLRRLAVQTAIANESPGKQVTVALRESTVPDRVDADIQVRDARPWSVALNLNNTGTRETGRDRFTIAGSHANVFDRDHQVAAAYTTSLKNPSDVRQIGLSYRVPLYDLGGVLGFGLTRSDVVGDFGSFTNSGAGKTHSLSYTHYLVPQGAYRSYVVLAFDDRQYDAGETVVGGVIVPTSTVGRRSRPLTLGYVGRKQGDNALWSYNVEVAANTGSGRGNSLAAYQSENPGIDTARWSALRLGGNHTTRFGGDWLAAVRAQAQFSSDALIAGEQFGLGGAQSVRGVAERPIAGDSGVFTSLEISTPEWVQGLRLSAFVDMGWLRNHNVAATGRLRSDRLASVGLGLRYGHASGAAFALDYGHVRTGSASSATNAPRKGDHKLHFSASIRF